MANQDIDFSIFEIEGYTEDWRHGRDYLHAFLHPINWDMQLIAVHGTFSRNAKASKDTADLIKKTYAEVDAYNGPHHYHYIDEYNYLLEMSAYENSAISMSSISVIAPMLESIFSQFFLRLGKEFEEHSMPLPQHHRWELSEGCPGRWSVKCHYKDGETCEDVISGISQLIKATGASAYLSKPIRRWVEAMFHYRNFMLHGGLEWSMERREAFAKLMSDKKYDDLFKAGSIGGEPWMFYILDKAVDEMVNNVEAILDGLAAFAEAFDKLKK